MTFVAWAPHDMSMSPADDFDYWANTSLGQSCGCCLSLKPAEKFRPHRADDTQADEFGNEWLDSHVPKSKVWQ
jgi:hypothetical protein